jgi:hypothetical protein
MTKMTSDKFPEALDHAAGIRLRENEARGRHVQSETHERQHEQQAREDGELQRRGRVEGDEEHGQREGDVERDVEIEQRGRNRDDHDREDHEHPDCEQQRSAAQRGEESHQRAPAPLTASRWR